MDGLVIKLKNKLIEVAQQESWISYGEVAEHLGIDLGNPDDRWGALGQLMAEVNNDSLQEGYMLTSVIVHKGQIGRRTEPGQGYFAMAMDVGLLKSENPFVFWGRQLQMCYAKHSDRRKKNEL